MTTTEYATKLRALADTIERLDAAPISICTGNHDGYVLFSSANFLRLFPVHTYEDKGDTRFYDAELNGFRFTSCKRLPASGKVSVTACET